MSSVSSLNSLLSSATTSTNTSSSSINLSSLLSAATGATSTGIDVTAAVAAAVYAARAPERQWQAQQATVKSQITALTNIRTSLSSLSGDLDSLNNLSGPLASRSVTSSAAGLVTATATSGAAVGSHTVTVNSLASSASWYSPAVASSAASLSSMKLQIVASNGSTNTFATGGTVNTLNDLASTINSSKIGVTASVVTDSTGSRLALVGNSSGNSNDFSVSFGTVSGSSWSSSSVASVSTALSAGSFQVGNSSQTSTINVAAGDTMADVASRVNNAGLGLTASVVTDSAGAHLSLTSSGGTVTVNGDPAFALKRASQGSNASLTVDGIPISSSSNTVSGAVSGLTIDLLGTTVGTQASLAVAANSSQIGSAVSQFVSDYNASLTLVNAQFSYDATSSSQGVLSGDSTIRSLQSALMGMVSYTGQSSSSGSSTASLASLGITMGDDGALTLDTAKLNDSVSNDPSAVQNFFQGTALNGFAQGFQSTLKAYSSASTGALTVGINNLNQSYTDLQSQVNEYESGYIASQRTVLTAMYSQAEIALQSLPAKLQQLQAQLGNKSGG